MRYFCESYVSKKTIMTTSFLSSSEKPYNIDSIVSIRFYNIPRACLLNRSPVPTMVLKSNRSGLWCHIIVTYRWLRWLCRKRSTMLRDMIEVQSSQYFLHDKNILSRDMNFMSRRRDYYVVTSILSEVAIHAFSVWLLLQCCDIRHNFFTVVQHVIKRLFYETAWSMLFWSHKNDVTSLVKISQRILTCGSYTP